MHIQRYFLGWESPIHQKLCEFILQPHNHNKELIDLEQLLIIVPTNRAIHRLKESLVQKCAESNRTLLPPLITTPTFLVRPISNESNVASRTEIAAAWAEVLTTVDLTQYNGLFPKQKPAQDYSWTIQMGTKIQQLRETLVDAVRQISDVYSDIADDFQENERWRDLSLLEALYIKQLEDHGIQDPCQLSIHKSIDPEIPSGIKHIIIAGTPNLTPIAIRALENMAGKIRISVLIHSPSSLADHFDEWGVPSLDKWSRHYIDIPNANENIFLSGSPASQASIAMEIIDSESGRFTPHDIAIAVPDRRIAPFMIAALAANGLRSSSPQAESTKTHPLFRLLESFHSLVTRGSYSDVSTFMRHADVLEYLGKQYHISPRQLLEEFDTLQNYHLPGGWQDIRHWTFYERTRKRYEVLPIAFTFIQQQIDFLDENDTDSAIRTLLHTIYQGRILQQCDPLDQAFICVANQINTALQELASAYINKNSASKDRAIQLLLNRLQHEQYTIGCTDTNIELYDWEDIAWSNAPLTIISGMNDEVVPGSILSDVFLPDSLRTYLNLRNDAQQLCLNIYLLQSIIESHRNKGRTCFIVGKTSTTGDPLKPSRLLFQCSDAELLRRCENLFGEPDEMKESHPATTSFQLEATYLPDVGIDSLSPSRMSVTKFNDFLTCPFRFYLKHILGMEEMGDEKREMDALDFGGLLHYALQRMAQRMHLCDDQQELSQFLGTQAGDWIKQRFGESPPLQIEIQLHAARQRLDAASRIHIDLLREGWEVLQSEVMIETELNGVTVSGRIDRIDQHQKTGRIRLLDYKTSDKASKPLDTHIHGISNEIPAYAKVVIDGKERRWINLQLPLYRIMLPNSAIYQGPIELGYFNLPKALGDTGIEIWSGFSNDLMQSARSCAISIIDEISNHRFWPPAEKVPYDNFTRLFHTGISECINVESFTRGHDGTESTTMNLGKSK
ncbi:MAG: PD-(D/E)XK nuclease family protein [Chloroflexota bacterium]|nr:PD-(D/E)XK nuclease family protein [Chloroflexota bacterium]